MSEDLGRRLVDPQLVDMLDGFAPLVLSPELLPALREVCRQPAPLHANQAPRAETVEALAPGPAGAPEVPVSITRPLDAPGPWPCVLHLHGGGYVVGAPSADAPQHRVLAAALGCCIISVDYRLAPESPFPGAIEDAYAVLSWASAQAPTLNLDPGRIGVMGESAGGGLAAALALLARDRGGPSLAFQHLIYPMIDDRTCVAADPHPFAGAYLWTPHNNRFGWTALLGRAPGGPDVSPYAAAARATLLSGLPPTFISTGALDLFLEEDLEYARRLTRAGVPVELHVYPGGFHAFDFHPSAEVAIQARRDSLEALRRAFRPRRPLSI